MIYLFYDLVYCIQEIMFIYFLQNWDKVPYNAQDLA